MLGVFLDPIKSVINNTSQQMKTCAMMGFSEGDNGLQSQLDFYFLDAKIEKVYEGRRKSFASLGQLKLRIKYV